MIRREILQIAMEQYKAGVRRERDERRDGITQAGKFVDNESPEKRRRWNRTPRT